MLPTKAMLMSVPELQLRAMFGSVAVPQRRAGMMSIAHVTSEGCVDAWAWATI